MSKSVHAGIKTKQATTHPFYIRKTLWEITIL